MSFGKGCAVKVPKVFTNVYELLPWISEVRNWPDNARPPLPTTLAPMTNDAGEPSMTSFSISIRMINKRRFITCLMAIHALTIIGASP